MKKHLVKSIAFLCLAALLACAALPAASAASPLDSVRNIFYNSGGRASVNPDGTLRQPTLAESLSLLSYRIDGNGIFYVEHSPWQKQFGFNQLYDISSPFLQLVYGTVRVKFTYDYVYKLDSKGQPIYDAKTKKPVYETDSKGNKIPKDWQIQMWKGRYGLVMLGGEIGVYTKPSTQKANHYNSALLEEELVFAIDLYQHNFKTGKTNYLFTRGPESSWWLTGFVPGNFNDNRANNKGKDEIIMVTNIQFPTKTMLDLFVKGMEKAGFRKGAPNYKNTETYTVSGNSIKFSWQYIDEDR